MEVTAEVGSDGGAKRISLVSDAEGKSDEEEEEDDDDDDDDDNG